jgi:hypothetical protein
LIDTDNTARRTQFRRITLVGVCIQPSQLTLVALAPFVKTPFFPTLPRLLFTPFGADQMVRNETNVRDRNTGEYTFVPK